MDSPIATPVNGPHPQIAMRPDAEGDPDSRIRAVAARQHGVVTRAQLLDAGLSSAGVGRRLKAGRLRALHRGVYLVGPLEPERAREMAAVLAGGPHAVLSHTSAGAVWGICRGTRDGPVHVSVPGSGRRGRPGIRFHRITTLVDDERASVDAIPITAPGRALVDLAAVLGSRELEHAMAHAEREGLVGSKRLETLLRRHRGRPGVPLLRALVRAGTVPDFTRSEAERRCLKLLRTAGLPRPHTNVAVGPYELDLFWPREGVAVEIDGRAHHTLRRRFEGDRRKDTWLHARGIQVVRLTWCQITRDSVATAVQVGQILALAGARDHGRPPREGPDRRNDG